MGIRAGARAASAVFGLAALTSIAVNGQQRNTAPAVRRLEPALIRNTVETAAQMLAREYRTAEDGERVGAMLRAAHASGAYDALDDPAALASRMTTDLATFSGDKHLAVLVTRPEPSPAGTPAPSRRDAARRDNGGIRRVEILVGNVGYLDIRAFWRPEESDREIAAAMQLLANADGLIVDVRENGGGSPDSVAHLASYLFDGADVPLYEIVPRSGPTVRYATRAVAAHDGRRPVYVLTSTRSFSAGEGFAFLLQDRGRAEVIGEPTAGAANPGRPYPINALFEIVIPNGTLRTIPSGRNWEGAGVRPDVPTTATEAARVAHERALRRLLIAASTPAERQRLETALAGPLGLR